jgi:serine phosphatase RsbU (regulator of sigma subunit)
MCSRIDQDLRIPHESGNAPAPRRLDESPYSQFTETLGCGDNLCFYTDALTEAAGASSRLLGEDGLLEIAQGLDVSEPGRMCRRSWRPLTGTEEAGR